MTCEPEGTASKYSILLARPSQLQEIDLSQRKESGKKKKQKQFQAKRSLPNSNL